MLHIYNIKTEQIRINDYFEIYEWRKQEFVRVDKK